MAKRERVREVLVAPPGAEYFQEKQKDGWKLVAVEWERGEVMEEEGEVRIREEVPYGLEVAEDCQYLVENPAEIRAMTIMLDLIVADLSLSEVAEELTRRGYLRRDGRKWTQVSLFELLPRLVDVAPRVYSSKEWAEREHRFLALVS